MWWKGGGKGGLIHFGAADIFTLIPIMQFKANKLKEQICTSELEVQILSKAHTDTEQICAQELDVQTLSQSNTDINIISTYKLKRFAHY
jgi:hypothetical protein